VLYSSVAIDGLGYVDAPVRITSSDLEARFAETLERLGQRPGLVQTLTGVTERRFFEEGVQPSDAATQAAEIALEDSGVDRERIAVCVNTSVCKDFIEPSVASTVHGNLGLSPACLNFDVGNACLAFLNGMEIVANMIERGQIDYGLVVDGENSRTAVEATVDRLSSPQTNADDLRDNFATLTLGSGAAAVILCRADLASKSHRFVGGVQRAATQHNRLCRGQPDRMTTDAGALLSAGVTLAEETWRHAERELGWTRDDLDQIVMHQVGSVHSSTLLKRLELPGDRAFLTFPTFGNMGPAAIPITLAKARDAGRLFPGDRVALMGIGSGLNCAMMEVRW
jgi:3-oxoacyl-[acyl-carrier-protein] synthase-3